MGENKGENKGFVIAFHSDENRYVALHCRDQAIAVIKPETVYKTNGRLQSRDPVEIARVRRRLGLENKICSDDSEALAFIKRKVSQGEHFFLEIDRQKVQLFNASHRSWFCMALIKVTRYDFAFLNHLNFSSEDREAIIDLVNESQLGELECVFPSVSKEEVA